MLEVENVAKSSSTIEIKIEAAIDSVKNKLPECSHNQMGKVRSEFILYVYIVLLD
mgnify:CR=1 FL=1